MKDMYQFPVLKAASTFFYPTDKRVHSQTFWTFCFFFVVSGCCCSSSGSCGLNQLSLEWISLTFSSGSKNFSIYVHRRKLKAASISVEFSPITLPSHPLRKKSLVGIQWCSMKVQDALQSAKSTQVWKSKKSRKSDFVKNVSMLYFWPQNGT